MLVKSFFVAVVSTAVAFTLTGCSIAGIVAANSAVPIAPSTAATGTTGTTGTTAGPTIAEPVCIYSIDLSNPCAARDEFRKIENAPLTLANVQRDFLDAYVPMFATGPGPIPMTPLQKKIKPYVIGVYGQINSANMACYKNMVLNQMYQSAQVDRGLYTVSSFDEMFSVAPAEPVEYLVDKVDDKLQNAVGFDWGTVYHVAAEDITKDNIASSVLLCS